MTGKNFAMFRKFQRAHDKQKHIFLTLTRLDFQAGKIA